MPFKFDILTKSWSATATLTLASTTCPSRRRARKLEDVSTAAWSGHVLSTTKRRADASCSASLMIASAPWATEVWHMPQAPTITGHEPCSIPTTWPRLAKCHKAAEIALAKADQIPISPTERALIEAIQLRYPVGAGAGVEAGAGNADDFDFERHNKAHANKTWTVYGDHQDNIDVLALFADALMVWRSKELFHTGTGKPIADSPVFEVRAVLNRGLGMPGVGGHAGIPHLYIHLMELSEEPEVTLAACDIIRNLVPDESIDVRWRTTRATIADDRYFAKHGGVNFYSLYRLHNCHSLIYACMLAGQKEQTLLACSRMEATITRGMLTVTSPPMADWLEFFLAVRVHVYVRFGMWDDIITLSVPEDTQLYCVTTVMAHYGQAVAYAALGRHDEADAQRCLYNEAATRVSDTRLHFPNRIVDVLKIATPMMNGEIEYRRQNYDAAFVFLRQAIKAEDALQYSELWGWMLSARHSYGALSLEQGLVEQAARAYAEDLGLVEDLVRAHQHPKNVWALHGYHECLVRMGRNSEAFVIKSLLKVALAEADVPIGPSCFCRRSN